MSVHFGSIVDAQSQSDTVAIKVATQDGKTIDLIADHVIAGTGYRFDAEKLPFLSPALKASLREDERFPILSTDFESSAPGLYFAGIASVYSFGPSMRFVCGAAYAAEKISGHIARSRKRYPTAASRPRAEGVA